MGECNTNGHISAQEFSRAGVHTPGLGDSAGTWRTRRNPQAFKANPGRRLKAVSRSSFLVSRGRRNCNDKKNRSSFLVPRFSKMLYGQREEKDRDQALAGQRRRGTGQDGEQGVEDGDRARERGIEDAVAIESGEQGEDADGQGANPTPTPIRYFMGPHSDPKINRNFLLTIVSNEI